MPDLDRSKTNVNATSAFIENENREIEQEEAETVPEKRKRLLYEIEDKPAVYLAFLFGFQNLLLSIASTVVVPLVVCREICVTDPSVKVKIISTFLVMNGAATILQCLVGVRLPIFQGGSMAFLSPILAMMATERWKCNGLERRLDETGLPGNATLDDYWVLPLREIQGSIMLASTTQMLLGGCGLIGPLLRFIGPLTITPCVAMIGLALTGLCNQLCSTHWGIAMASISLLFVFALYISEVRVPIPHYDRSERRCSSSLWPIFKLLPVIFMIAIVWSLCIVLQACGVLEGVEGAQTNFTPVSEAVWFYFPYPGQWGMPTVSVASYVGMLFACLASMIESVGDYHAAARACQIGQPPTHAVNRGILVEGLGCFIAGALGAGGAVTSFSNNIGAISITSMGARVAYVWCGVLLILCGVFGKFGAIFTVLPEPIIGANLTVGLAMVVSVALTNLQQVDLSSSRNQCILGTSLMMGLMVPQYIKQNPINTGYDMLDQALAVTLGTPMVVGAVIGCFLDNTAPGTLKERGMAAWRSTTNSESDGKTYNLPYVQKYQRLNWMRKLPFVQDFDT